MTEKWMGEKLWADELETSSTSGEIETGKMNRGHLQGGTEGGSKKHFDEVSAEKITQFCLIDVSRIRFI